MTRVLLVEDDPALGFVIKDNLVNRGFDVTLCKDGVEGQHVFRKGAFDLCILDVMLPRKDGFSLAQHIRKEDLQVPVLFLTAKTMTEDKIAGFKAGGDDYIVKPFQMEELLLRMEVFLRRSKPASVTGEKIQLGSYLFDCHNLTLTHPSQTKVLTHKEAEVLRLLCEHRDRVLKRDEILRKIWGDDDYFMGRSLDVFISKLRKYLREDPAIEIVNYHGVGFRLQVPV